MQTLRSLTRACASMVSLGGLLIAAPAFASDEDIGALGPGYSAAGALLGAPSELRIDLRGEVPARCRVTSVSGLGAQLDFNRSGNANSRFGIDCNTPFLFRLRSGEGGFAAQHASEGVARLIAYDVAVDIDTDSGMNALGWCRSTQLTNSGADCAFGAQGWSSGDATAIDRTGSLNLKWSAPGEGEAPALGKYRDTIVIDLSVRG